MLKNEKNVWLSLQGPQNSPSQCSAQHVANVLPLRPNQPWSRRPLPQPRPASESGVQTGCPPAPVPKARAPSHAQSPPCGRSDHLLQPRMPGHEWQVLEQEALWARQGPAGAGDPEGTGVVPQLCIVPPWATSRSPDFPGCETGLIQPHACRWRVKCDHAGSSHVSSLPHCPGSMPQAGVGPTAESEVPEPRLLTDNPRRCHRRGGVGDLGPDASPRGAAVPVRHWAPDVLPAGSDARTEAPTRRQP